MGGSGTSYINTASQCDANTLFENQEGKTEWAMPGSSPTASVSSSDWSEFQTPTGSTSYVRVVLSTLYENGTSTSTTEQPTMPLSTGTGIDDVTTSEPSAPFGNTTESVPLSAGFTGTGTGIESVPTSEPGAPFGNSTSTTETITQSPPLSTGITGTGSDETTTGDATGPFTNSTSSTRACGFVCPDYIDACGNTYGPGCYTSCPGVPGPSFSTPSCSLTTSAPIGTGSSSISSSIVGPFTNSSTSTGDDTTLISPVQSSTSSIGSSTSSAAPQTVVTTQTVTSVGTETVTLKNGTSTVVQTSEVPFTLTIVEPARTVTSFETQTLTLTREGQNGTTTVTQVSVVPHTTTIDRPVRYTEVRTSYMTKTLTTTKTGKNGNPTTVYKTTKVRVPYTKTVKPPVSYRTKTVISSAVVTLPCSTKSCRKSSTTAVFVHNTTRVDVITASCATYPPVYVTKTSTFKTTLSSPKKVITTQSCDTYTVPPSSTWVFQPETSCLSNSTSSIVRPVNSTRSAISSTSSIVSPVNSTRPASSSTCTIYATSVSTISRRNTTSLSTISVVASTTVVPIQTTPVAPVTPGSSAPATSPIAPGTQPSAPASSSVAPVSPQSPASPAGSDTTLTTRIGSTIQVSSPFIVTATRESPVSPQQPEQPEQPQTPVSPEQPSTPVSPEQPQQPQQPESPVSPQQPSTPVSPEQPSAPVSPEQPTPVSLEQPSTPISPEQPESPVSPEQPTTPVSPEQPQSSASSSHTVEFPPFTEPTVIPSSSKCTYADPSSVPQRMNTDSFLSTAPTAAAVTLDVTALYGLPAFGALMMLL